MGRGNTRKALVFTILASVLCVDSAAQNAGRTYWIPEPLAISEKPGHSPFLPSVFPVGWSRDGYFAWIEVERISGQDSEDVTYMIIDTVEDMVVWRLRDDVSWGRARKAGWDGSVVEYSWNDFGSEYVPQLRAFGIVQSRYSYFGSFPALDLGTRVTAEISVEFPDSDSGPGPAQMDSYTVTADSTGHGRKQITTNSRTDATDAWILGYVRSPFESRIAVAVATEHPGLEGPPNRVRIRFYGCHLKVGFELPSTQSRLRALRTTQSPERVSTERS